ncbi:RecF/RecN/SMC N terminal domain containing protein, putative [Angomonas deanei]|uniref:Structural maintenance of chromosomes protein 4 n=1 Tax=Angomonas deanei TaxID=59799 RepID=A0A7G2CNK8_9TRYP|nr:RecF/RecN/SMC N terminal domain containing protein, putative [Angomonas deanei]
MESETERIHALREQLEGENETAYQKECKALVEEIGVWEDNKEKAEKNRLAHHKEIEELEAKIEKTGGATFKQVSDALKGEQERVEAEESSLRTCRRNIQKHRAAQERKEEDIKEHQKKLQKIEAEAEEGAKEQIAECAAQLEELVRQLIASEQKLAKVQASADEAKANIPIAHSSLVAAQKKLDDETRYEQTEKVKLADAMQQINQFEVKINDCEDKIRNNAELYGVETLLIETADEKGEEEDEEAEDKSARDSLYDEEDEEDEEEEHNKQKGRKRGRRNSGGSSSRGSKRQRLEESEERPPKTNVSQMTFRLTPEELERCDYDRSYHLAKALTEETKRLHDEIDFRAVALWRERDLAHRQALAVYQERKEVSDKLEEELADLKERRRSAFMSVFEIIRKKLKEVYQLLTHGGDADMELVDTGDPFEGIQFVVRPPKKSWKQISNLSGGEKTLSSLALIFALHHVKPTPIYVMDEIDAALDFRNVSIVANYVLRQATGAQFIIISLRNNMFEVAHQLVGVCKVNDVTSTLVLMPRAFQERMNNLLGVHKKEAEKRVREVDEAEESSHQQEGGGMKSCLRGSVEDGRLSKKNVRFSTSSQTGKDGILTQ